MNTPEQAYQQPTVVSGSPLGGLVYAMIIAFNDTYEGIYYRATIPSFLESPEEVKHGIFFDSLSKKHNITGWRVGFGAGSAGVVAFLRKPQKHTDFCTFSAIQHVDTSLEWMSSTWPRCPNAARHWLLGARWQKVSKLTSIRAMIDER